MEKTTAKHMSTAQMTVTALMTAITCILAPMALPIPISPVPISLTNLVIFFMAYILGMKLSVASYVLYLLLGTVGLPVFSGFSGGVGKLLGPTGGYLIGFIFLAAIAGFFVEKFPAKIYMHVVGMIIGMAICYIFGTAWLAGQLGMSFVAALGVGVIPYLPGDTAKIIIAIIAGPQIRKAVSVPLVLHGCSGIPDEQMREAVNLGMSKFNIATEYFAATYDAFNATIEKTGHNRNGVAMFFGVQQGMVDFVRGKIRLLNPNGFSL